MHTVSANVLLDSVLVSVRSPWSAFFVSVVLHWYRRHVTVVELSVRHSAAVNLGRNGCVDLWSLAFFDSGLSSSFLVPEMLLQSSSSMCSTWPAYAPTMWHDAWLDFFLHLPVSAVFQRRRFEDTSCRRGER